MYRIKSLLTVMLGLVLVVGSQVGTAQGNSQGNGNGKANAHASANVKASAKAKGFGKSQNIGVGNASDGIMGRILTDRSIFYTGDPLSIRVKFPRGAELITSGDADAYVVIFAPIPAATDDSSEESSDESSAGTGDVLSDAIVLQVSSEASPNETTLFSVDAVDVSELPAGTYQLGLILTNPGGDPLTINDWYGGLLGLEHVRGLTVASAAVDFDADGDGEVDDDTNGDGFSDDDSSD